MGSPTSDELASLSPL